MQETIVRLTCVFLNHLACSLQDVESILNMILSFVYYFYNLMPLTRGSSVVAYSVALGLFMAIGREVTGKIPQGKVNINLYCLFTGMVFLYN